MFITSFGEQNITYKCCSNFLIHLLIDWKNQLLEQSINIFSRPTAQQEPEIDLKALHAKIGHQALQIDFLEGALRKIGQLSGKK